MKSLLCIGVAITLMYHSVASGTLSREPGEPGFSIELVPVALQQALQHRVPRGDAGVIVRASCACARSAVADVSLFPSKGLSVLGNRSSWRVHPSPLWMGERDREFVVMVRPDGAVGDFELRAKLHVWSHTDSSMWDEMEGVLRLSVAGDSMEFGQFQPVRMERVERGRRFRYGGMHLVAIEGPEDMIQGRIQKKPEAIKRVSAICSECVTGRDQVAMRLAVTVNREGFVSWVEPPSAQTDTLLWNAAATAARQWRFEPALAGGKPFSDWAEIDVVISTARN